MRILTIIIHLLILTPMVNAQPQGAYAQLKGINMYYEIHGTGYPLVLIHGGGSTIGTTFGRILPELAKNHQVIEKFLNNKSL